MASTGQSAPKKDDDDEDGGSAAGGGQAQMMKSMTTIMPIMFGFFSLSFSTGLSIYFVTSNIIGMLQYSPQGKRLMEKVFRSKKSEEAPVEIVFDDEVEAPTRKRRKSRKKKPRRK